MGSNSKSTSHLERRTESFGVVLISPCFAPCPKRCVSSNVGRGPKSSNLDLKEQRVIDRTCPYHERLALVAQLLSCSAGRFTVNYFREIVMEANETMKPNRRGFLQDAGAASARFDLGGLPFATHAPRRARHD